MKWKFIIILFAIAGLGVVGIIKYYNFSWSELADVSFYESLANPSMRFIKIQEGWRKEQVGQAMADKLGWDETQKDAFINAPLALADTAGVTGQKQTNAEGYYFPQTYIVPKDQSPSAVSALMFSTFSKETSKIKKPAATRILNEDTAVKIASIIQRESGGKSDMNLISGIIWNRIFKGMKLQMDATLQYAKGTEDKWWPQVDPADKNIKSPYNTYLYASLPPSAIANPGLAALAAAYNPQKTDCLFYLHDKKGHIHCARTYEEHKANIAKYY